MSFFNQVIKSTFKKTLVHIVGHFIFILIAIVFPGCGKNNFIDQRQKSVSGASTVQQDNLSSGTNARTTRAPVYDLDFTWSQSLPESDTTLDSINQLLRACMTGNLAVVQQLVESGINPDASGLIGRTPLMVAARYGHVDIITYLCSRGVDINRMRTFLGGWSSAMYPFCDLSGGSALLECAINGDTSVMKLLISNGANKHQKNALKNTALFYAVQEGHISMVQLLLEMGADINIFNQLSETPLSYAVRNNQIAMVELLCKQETRINTITLADALSAAADSNDITMAELLLSTGINHDTIFQNGPDYRSTPLCYAASLGNVSIVKFLLANGANVEGVPGCTYTPLCEALMNGHDTIAELLLEHGAKIPAPQTYYRDMWIDAVHTDNTKLVNLLIKHANSEMVTSFLQQRIDRILMLKGPMFDLLFPLCISRLNIDTKSDSFTACFYKKYRPPHSNNCPEVPVGRIASLMHYGATFNAESFGITPLMLHSAAGLLDSMKVDMGENNDRNLMREININMRINGCYSALDYAILDEQVDAVKLLVESGASLNSHDYESNYRQSALPLDNAFSTGNKEIVAFLLSKDARSRYTRLVNGFPPDIVYNHLTGEYGHRNTQYLPPILAMLQFGWKDLFYKECDRADSVLTTYDYRAAFLLAAGGGDVDVAEELLRRYPELASEIYLPPEEISQDGRDEIDSIFTTYGGAAFLNAAKLGKIDVLKLMVQQTTPPNGWRPFIPQALIYSENYGRRQTTEFLTKLYY